MSTCHGSCDLIDSQDNNQDANNLKGEPTKGPHLSLCTRLTGTKTAPDSYFIRLRTDEDHGDAIHWLCTGFVFSPRHLCHSELDWEIRSVAETSFPGQVDVSDVNLHTVIGPCTVHLRKRAGPCFNIKMPSYQYRKSHCGDKTVVRSSYLHNGISYTGKMASLYWIRALLMLMLDCRKLNAHVAKSDLHLFPLRPYRLTHSNWSLWCSPGSENPGETFSNALDWPETGRCLLIVILWTVELCFTKSYHHEQ